ncbi:MAG: hypothetical protein A3G18_10685 [Rhodospirillales bacterium RIFCSPLOWO2_12_FULL_58_28]|nr:MAG: hypothetical protein A3H92_11040 [Rhodospirillales bacterium RIFCSPLOWO2_02_FULL_58_16]OHC77885.1 MAG: hypothetical protein A3G18_10685 [Rhodospirillales bacterium RIFCSPLOWO2_12_FULL_58_28]
MPHNNRPRKLSIVVFSGDFDKVHYALVMASAAAAVNTPATLFFTMEACRALGKPGPDGEAAWRAMPVSRGRAVHGDDVGGDLDDDFLENGVAGFEELLASCVLLGVRFMVCEMGLKAIGLSGGSLRDDVPIKAGGVVSFLNDASKDGAMLFI